MKSKIEELAEAFREEPKKRPVMPAVISSQGWASTTVGGSCHNVIMGGDQSIISGGSNSPITGNIITGSFVANSLNIFADVSTYDHGIYGMSIYDKNINEYDELDNIINYGY